MDNQSQLRRLLPYIFWVAGIFALYFLLNFLISPFASGISLNLKTIVARSVEIGTFLVGIGIGLALVEVYFYQMFFRQPSNPTTKIVMRGLQVIIGVMAALTLFAFFEKTDLFRLGDSLFATIIHLPLNLFGSLQKSATSMGAAKGNASLMG